MKKTFLFKLLTVILLMCFACFITAACSGQGDLNNGNNANEIYSIYSTYVVYSESNGQIPLAYEEWLANIKGEKGEPGKQGENGKDGKDGQDGITPTIEISSDGYWVINGEKTEHKAVATDGKDGADGVNGEDGRDGKDGITPTIEISTDGYWVINGEKTEHKAVAIDGKDGADGVNGEDGKDGKDGQDGITPTIEISTDGYWVINGEKTEHKAVATDELSHTESEWIIDNEATCEKIGIKHKECINCKALLKIDIIMALNHKYVGEVCEYCQEEYYTKNLRYVINSDNSGYILLGMGMASDKDIVIASIHNGLPVVEIYDSAFGQENTNYVSYITSVKIPNSVIKIGNDAFMGLDSLTSIIIPKSVIDMGNSVFYGSFGTIYCEAEIKPSGWDENWNNSAPIVWDCNNNDIANNGYIYTEIDGLRYGIKDDVATVIGQNKNITIANIPSSINYKGNSYTVSNIANYAFNYCSSLTSIKIGNSITSIGVGAFGNCSSLTSITIGNSVASIGEYAFANCSSLTSIIIPIRVQSIGYNTFNNCNALETIYCEIQAKPSGWASSWMGNTAAELVWGYKG